MNKLTEISILIVGGFAMTVGLLFTGVGLYIAPALLFDWQYDLPDHVAHLANYLAAQHGLADWGLALAVILPLIISGFCLLGISRYASTLLVKKRSDDTEITAQPVPKIETVPEIKLGLLDRMHPLIKLLLGIITVLLLLGLAEFLLKVEFSIF